MKKPDAFDRHVALAEKTEQHCRRDIKAGERLFVGATTGGRTVFFCGNGGSAASSQHFAAELVGRYVKERGPLPSLALTTDTSALTAIGNDYGFERIFSRQIEALGEKGDLLIALTTSGASPNVLHALKAARRKKMKTVALTGASGTGLRKAADVCIAVPSKETARIQEMHDLILHSWCEALDAEY